MDSSAALLARTFGGTARCLRSPARSASRRAPHKQHKARPCASASAHSRPTNPVAAVPALRILGEGLRADFPILHQEVSGRPLVYLDNAATSQKPTVVLDTLAHYYRVDNANVHRGVHALAARATCRFEAARDQVAAFLHSPSPAQVVWTRGATEAINLVANTWGAQNLGPSDEVALSVLEHHSNLVPWQLLALRTGCVLRFAPLAPGLQPPGVDEWSSVIGPRTKLIATAHVSNVLGSTAPVQALREMARPYGALLLLDACQSVPHAPVDVTTLGADFLVASGHKMCGPTGIGFLWARAELLESMPPWQGGGEMIDTVTLQTSTFAPPPARFEAGTPHIAGAIGLGAACEYLSGLDMARVSDWEHQLGGYLVQELARVPGVRIYGPAVGQPRAALATFNVSRLHATDVSTLLDAQGIAVRSGHHCTQPLHAALGCSASARASLYIYNTAAEVDTFVEALRDTISFLHEAGV